MVVKLLASAGNSPTAPWAAGLLFLLSVMGEALLEYLQDKYKRVKDHNSQSGNNRESFEYFDEMDEVLGSKPNITLKEIVECGLAEDATATAVGDSEASPESNIPADPKSDTDLEQEFEKNLKGNPKHSKKGAKEKPLP